MRTARSLTASRSIHWEGAGGRGRACLGVHATHAPPTEFLTHACENITFPQLLLRAVIITATTRSAQ